MGTKAKVIAFPVLPDFLLGPVFLGKVDGGKIAFSACFHQI